MKVVFYFYSAYSGTILGLLLDEAKKMSIVNKDDVYFVMCDGFLDVCLSNPTGNSGVCAICKLVTKYTLEKHLKGIAKILYLNDFIINNSENISINYSNVEEYKKIEYKNVKIGYASLSTYIHLTRNQQPLIDKNSKKYFDILLKQSIRLTDTFLSLVKKINPDKICTYNGRFNEIRPVYEVAKSLSIPVYLYEIVSKENSLFYKIVFQNALPHNIKNQLPRIEQCWNNPDFCEGQNILLGKSFFEKRRKGIFAGDKVYIRDQKKGCLPKNWDANKINIVIYNSSEDEFVAIGDEYSSHSLFTNQLEGLKIIFNKFEFREDIHFYLRIHPNLKNVKYKYHTDLYNFEKEFLNVTVISPVDSISTYDLMDAAEKVIVFGSTIGFESVYWGKPVILLSSSFYYFSNICYIPKSYEDLFSLIDQKLPPLYNDNVLKLGVYYLNQDPLIVDLDKQFYFIDFNLFKKKIFGKTYHGFNYQKFLYSKVLFAFLVAICRGCALILIRKKFLVPTKDE